MTDSEDPSVAGCVADTMVLAMFVDAGYAHLLTALAGGNLFITPAIIEPAVIPPFDSPPSAEFAQGAFFFQ